MRSRSSLLLLLPSAAAAVLPAHAARAPAAAFSCIARKKAAASRLRMSSAGAGRRDALRRVAAWGIAAAAAAPGVPAASARDELFKPNPLTNPVLEKIRILEQDYADNVQYGGELAPGSPQGRDQYAQLLVPILKMQRDLDDVYGLVREEDGAGLERADQLLRQKVFEKKEFKKTFNAFADNIYYSDPDRANAYLGGGAVPKNEQSIAYLVRNDVLTNLENLQAEVTYLRKEKHTGGPLETEDLYSYSTLVKEGMVKYLELVPPGELRRGKEYLAESGSA